MSICKKCWNDAYGGGYYDGCETQTHRYHQLLEERKDKPCTKKQQGWPEPEPERP